MVYWLCTPPSFPVKVCLAVFAASPGTRSTSCAHFSGALLLEQLPTASGPLISTFAESVVFPLMQAMLEQMSDKSADGNGGSTAQPPRRQTLRRSPSLPPVSQAGF